MNGYSTKILISNVNLLQEIIGGMLDLNRDIWRKPKKEHFDQQREKVLKFSEIWKKYEPEIKKS